jgi:hypothetical protein
MAQKGFPENPNVGDTFKKDGKNYVFQGDRWVIKGDFAGPDPGTKNGQEWTNVRTDKTYTWDAKTKTWGEKGASSPTTTDGPAKTTTTTGAPTTTNPPKKTTTTTAAPKKTPTTTAAPTTTVPVTTTTVPVTTTTVPKGLPGGDNTSNITDDYQAAYVEAQNNAYGYLSNISKKQRIEFLNALYAKGFGSGTKPTSGGLEDSDIAIAAQFYVYYRGSSFSTTNPTGYKTVDEAYRDIKTWKTVATAGAGKFTPKIDATSAFRQVMQNDLGRGPTDQEVERFYNAYRSLESGGNAPNISAAAQTQIEETMPGESEAASFSNYANVFEQLMRGA